MIFNKLIIWLIKLVSLPVYICDIMYDTGKLLLFTSTEKLTKFTYNGNSYLLLSDIHKIEKACSFPRHDKNRQGKIRFIIKFRMKKHRNNDNINDYGETLLNSFEKIQPVSIKSIYSKGHEKSISESIIQRRSVRHFSKQSIPEEIIEKIILTARNAPSSCNRQPVKVHVYNSTELINKLLKLQNGNKGFGDNIPCLLLLTYTIESYYTSSERKSGIIDASLFSMCVSLAAMEEGLGTCMLNTGLYAPKEILLHKIASIPFSESIVMMMGIGYPHELAQALVPFHRKTNQIIINHT